MNSYEKQWREEVFSQIVEYRVKPFKYERDGKWFDTQIVIHNKTLRALVEGQARRTPVPFQDYVDDAVFHIYSAIMEFELDGEWEELALGNDRRNWNRLISRLKKEIKYELPKEYRNGYETTKNVKTVSGKNKKVHLYVSPVSTSLDALIINQKDGDETPVIETVMESFWETNKNAEYKANLFYEWYKANYERILTKSQREFIAELQKFNYGADDKQSAMIRQYSDIDTRTIALKLNRIKEKLLKQWNKESKFFRLTYCEQILHKRLNLLKLYFDIVESDVDLDRQNKRLSNFILSNIDATIIEMLMDKMSEDDRKEIIYSYQNKTQIINEVLYRFTIIAEQEITEIEMQLANEQAIKEEVMKKEKVEAPKDFIVPDGVSCIYLTLNSQTANIEDAQY